ncbi:MAG: diguanylate cyclase [Gammaproteobacteria bacterium]|nr:diguanylate cyclase [Gammaproteobacteria bacterium]
MPIGNNVFISEKETEAILSQLHRAGKNHILWLASLHEHLLCDGPLPQDVCESDAHHHCNFGSWYYDEVPDSIRAEDDFQEVGKVHKAMHIAARQLVHSWQRDETIELSEYQAFIKQQHELIALISQIRDRLNVVLMSYDNLTGALRREAFMLLFEKELSQSKRSDSEFCIVMLDLDFFKKINDTYGHLVGDKVLQQTALTISQSLRSYDSLCRYGGEEFVILLPKTKVGEAIAVIERVRKAVESQVVVTDDNLEVKVTLSAGIAPVEPESNISTNIDHADSELYKAKSQGRNRICVR